MSLFIANTFGLRKTPKNYEDMKGQSLKQRVALDLSTGNLV
jgi:hypothetical protein